MNVILSCKIIGLKIIISAQDPYLILGYVLWVRGRKILDPGKCLNAIASILTI
ncbi:MAG: hypothetical protein ACTSU4_00560 [Promethearchaeota archaeon]